MAGHLDGAGAELLLLPGAGAAGRGAGGSGCFGGGGMGPFEGEERNLLVTALNRLLMPAVGGHGCGE